MNHSEIAQRIGSPESKKQFNYSLFTRVAEEYDIATCVMSLGGDARWKRKLVQALPQLDSPTCLDLACGTGDVAFQLEKRFPNSEILGIDLTPAMIDVARQRCESRRVTFRSADMCHTGLPDGWADVVTGSYALRNAPRLTDALREVRRVLRPNGWAAFLDFSKSPIGIVQSLQLGVLKGWGGLCGVMIHGRPEHAYIAESLRQFPDRLEFHRQLEVSGFKIAVKRSFYFGTLELLVLQRH